MDCVGSIARRGCGTLIGVNGDLDRVLIRRDQIASRIAELGRQIASDLEPLAPGGGIILVPVLTGAIIFVADLMRQLPHKMRLGVVTVSSYRGRTIADDNAMIVGVLPEDIRGRHALIVDDILDSGRTIRLLRQRMLDGGAASVRTCVLLRKQNDAAMSTPCEYVGFEIPDEFVVGYGLDYDNYYRNLPDVGTLKREAM